jgi:hypothetical protein
MVSVAGLSRACAHGALHVRHRPGVSPGRQLLAGIQRAQQLRAQVEALGERLGQRFS